MEAIPTQAVLIADSDPGFVFWLGQALDNAGYLGLPAKSIEEATKLLGHLSLEIDLLIVNPSLEGAREFADHLRRVQGHLKVIAVIHESDQPSSPFLEADATELKPLNPDNQSVIQWLRTIERVLKPSGRIAGLRVSEVPGG